MKYFFLNFFIFGLASLALAEDPRDAEIFGDSANSSLESTPQDAKYKPSDATSVPSLLLETLQVGGRLELRTTLGHQESEKFAKSSVSQLRQADLYFDSRPHPDLRTFLRLRWREQIGAGLTGGTAGTVPVASPSTSSPQPSPDSSSTTTTTRQSPASKLSQNIDELWFKWDQDERLFWTIGKQHLKWGSGRFWNPTDFTAVEVRDPIEAFDRRLGQNLIKLHIPVEKQAFNFYGVAQFDEATQLDQLRAGLRAELAFLGSGEAALTVYSESGGGQRLGVDVSSALGPIDVYIEGAQIRQKQHLVYEGELKETGEQLPIARTRFDHVSRQIVGGITRQWQYSSSDSLTLGIESFYNELGYEDRKLELYAMLRGGARPLYAGRRYAAAFLLLPAPFAWNDTTLRLSTLKNGTDGTRLTSAVVSWNLLRQANVEVFANRCDGDYGEFCLRVPEVYRVFAPNLPIRRTLLSVGAGISMAF